VEKENMENVNLAITDFGGLVRKIRNQKGMSLQELSDKTNLSPSYIFRLEKGYRGCELSNRLNIMINGLSWGLEDVQEYFQKVISDKEGLKKITD
jgi:transcriptional regulator with XRE-family HTH domain